VGDGAVYLQENMTCKVQLFDGNPVAIELPQRVTLEIIETEPTVKGQTASSSYKPAILSNGARTMVPPHVGVGTRVVIMTEDGLGTLQVPHFPLAGSCADVFQALDAESGSQPGPNFAAGLLVLHASRSMSSP